MKNARKLLLIAICVFPADLVVAQPPNAMPRVSSYPLYCQGPLVTSSGTTPLTPFKRASEGANDATPGPGECAWADRAPRGTEIKSGNGNVISGPLNQVANLPVGKFAEIGVHHDQESHEMVVTRVVGLVTPPFNAVPEGIQVDAASLISQSPVVCSYSASGPPSPPNCPTKYQSTVISFSPSSPTASDSITAFVPFTVKGCQGQLKAVNLAINGSNIAITFSEGRSRGGPGWSVPCS